MDKLREQKQIACTGCKELLPITEFHRNKSKSSGYNNKCKSCRSYHLKVYYANNKELYSSKRKNINSKYTLLKSTAKKRNIYLDLTIEEYKEINSNPCHYCGGGLPEVGYALDRIDSDKGYTKDNVLPCCKLCNQAKNSLSMEEFKQLIVTIYNNMELNNG